MSAFPVDPTTLILLNAACEMNPDSGHTELTTFLSMGERIKSQTLVGEGTIPIYEVKFEDGHEPFTPHDVIQALVAEIQRLRENWP